MVVGIETKTMSQSAGFARINQKQFDLILETTKMTDYEEVECVYTFMGIEYILNKIKKDCEKLIYNIFNSESFIGELKHFVVELSDGSTLDVSDPSEILWYNDLNMVKKINLFLSDIDIEHIIQNYNIDELNSKNIYGGWDNDSLNYLLEEFVAIKRIYNSAALKNEYIFASMNPD